MKSDNADNPARPARPRVAVFKFASCDGCQLSLLDLEDALLAVAGAVDIAYFPEASRRMLKGPYELGLVEGSITTHHDAERIQQIRRQCRKLVTLGACATAGGIQALRNWQHVDEMMRVVYATPSYISTLRTSTPIADHVPVDFELRGCPISKHQLVELLCAFLAGRKPNIPDLLGLHGMQAPRQRVPARGAGRSVSRAGDTGRMRRAMPELQPRLLWMLRALGVSEYKFPDREAAGCSAWTTKRSCVPSRIQWLGLAVSGGQ